MLFLTFKNTNIRFSDLEFIWKFYTTNKTISTTKLVKIIDKKIFANVVVYKNIKFCILHNDFFNITFVLIYLI